MTQDEMNVLSRDDLEKLKFVLDLNWDIAIRVIWSSWATSFLTLTDTYSDFTWKSLQLNRVNVGETAIESVTADKDLVWLWNVDNTSDENKPVSIAQATAIWTKQDTLWFISENVSNKSTTLDTDQASDTKYPSVKSVYDWAVWKFQSILISWTNIKTINSNSILWAWDIVITWWAWDMVLSSIQSVTWLKTFDKDKIATKWTSTWVTTISTANTSATNYTQTLPARTWTVANLDDVTYIGTTSVALNRTSWALTLDWITLTTPNIGTPSAWTLTNCTMPRTIISSWLTQNTAKLLWRSTAWTGAVEELSLWTWLSFTWTTLNVSGGSNPIFTTWIQGQIYTWVIDRFLAKWTQTIAWVKISLASLPTWANVSVDIRKNWIASANSIFTSDTPISITTAQWATNWIYITTWTTIDNWSLVENDVLYIVVTLVWSTLPWSDLEVVIY